MKQKIRELFSPTLIPNFITLFRAKTALLFFIVIPFSTFFYFLYVVCALTDMLDGFLARKLNAVTKLGQCLDSLADLMFFVAVSIRVVPLLSPEPWMLIWSGLILAIKVVTLLIGFVKFHEFSFLHTYENKLTGLLLFAYPALIGWFGMLIPTAVVCVVATVTAIEEQFILIKMKRLHRDIKGLYEVKSYN